MLTIQYSRDRCHKNLRRSEASERVMKMLVPGFTIILPLSVVAGPSETYAKPFPGFNDTPGFPQQRSAGLPWAQE